MLNQSIFYTKQPLCPLNKILPSFTFYLFLFKLNSLFTYFLNTQTMNKALPDTIYAIQHSAFEDLGSIEDLFYQLGYRVRYFEAGIEDLSKAFEHAGLTVILGGPIGVNEIADYPFLQKEIDLLKVRIKNNLPTLGICLGAQLIAHALGAKVYAGHTKEIGWSSLQLTNQTDNILAPLAQTPVLHWHGDTFDLPKNTQLLASSVQYPNQAFSKGSNILALQFHLEAAADSMEKWLIGHTCELRQAGISIPELRIACQQQAPLLEQRACNVIQTYMQHLQLQ